MCLTILTSNLSVCLTILRLIDVKNDFYYFYKKTRFKRFFIFSNVFYFLVVKFFILLNLLNSCIKQFLSDEFNMASIKHSLMKSRSPRTLSCILRQKFY